MSDAPPEKRCPACKETKSAAEFYGNPARHDGLDVYCKPCKSAYHKRPEYREQDRQRVAADRDRILARRRKRDAENADRIREQRRKWNRAYTARIRKAVFDHYGWSCAQCEATDRLSIDHVNEDGYEHRKELFGERGGNRGGAFRFYGWLVKNDFPDGFQTLCIPCNTRKQNKARAAARKEAAA
jgi:hypothetical protein